MKKTLLLPLLAAICMTNYSCTPKPETSTFEFTVEEDHDLKNLPALQSFAFAEMNDVWLMVGGRTNGFHGFGDQQDFPFKMASQHIYVYDPKGHKLDSVSVSLLPLPLQQQYTATNMAARQVGKYLYICGGYGEINPGTPNAAWVTHNIISRIDVQQMIDAVRSADTSAAARTAALAKAVAIDTNEAMRCTGGELYKLPDGKFYLVLGHNFTGKYSDTAAQQVYLDAVRVFTLTEDATSIKLGPVSSITDGLPDSTTQFRRRDLVVTPNVQQGGKTYGISIYGGVFTYTSGCPSCNGGNPFRNPIYITGYDSPGYYIETGYSQLSNIYSAPSLQMYDPAGDIMYTTIFGGLGDTALVNGDNASFIKRITTQSRNNKTNTTSAVYNIPALPDYAGSEGVLIRDKKTPVYQNNELGIIDYAQLKKGKHLLGHIYGGIYSDSTQWNNQPYNVDSTGKKTPVKMNITSASHKVYKVWIHKK
jgi:hypothetical protein